LSRDAPKTFVCGVRHARDVLGDVGAAARRFRDVAGESRLWSPSAPRTALAIVFWIS